MKCIRFNQFIVAAFFLFIYTQIFTQPLAPFWNEDDPHEYTLRAENGEWYMGNKIYFTVNTKVGETRVDVVVYYLNPSDSDLKTIVVPRYTIVGRKEKDPILGTCLGMGRAMVNEFFTTLCHEESDLSLIQYEIELTFRHKKSPDQPCADGERNRSSLFFQVIRPSPTLPPIIEPIYGAYCPNTTVPMKATGVSTPDPFNTPDGTLEAETVYWYDMDDPNSSPIYGKKMAEGWSYEVYMGENEVKNIEARQVLKYKACTFIGSSMRATLTSPVSPPLVPPNPKFKVVCDNSCIAVDNPLNYDGLLWYNEVDDAVSEAVHEGWSFCASGFSGLKIYYMQYYKEIYEGCVLYSPKTPAYFILPPRLPVLPEISQTIYDHRDMDEPNCEVERDPNGRVLFPFYYDLPSINDMPEIQAFKATMEEFSQSLNQTGFLRVEGLSIDGHWDAGYTQYDIEEDYKIRQNELGQWVNRVCPENITPDKTIKDRRTYYLRGRFNFSIVLYNQYVPEGHLPEEVGATVLMSEYVDECNSDRFPTSRVNINLAPLAGGGGCSMPDEALLEEFFDLSPETCDRHEIIALCPGKYAEVGPTEDMIYEFFESKYGDQIGIAPALWKQFTTYKWSPAQGLSKTDEPRTTVNYDQAPKDQGDIVKYTLTIKYEPPGGIGGSTWHYCVFVRKCRRCTGTLDLDNRWPVY